MRASAPLSVGYACVTSDMGSEVTLHEAQQRGDELKGMLADRFGIGHSTLELECHPCDDDMH